MSHRREGSTWCPSFDRSPSIPASFGSYLAISYWFFVSALFSNAAIGAFALCYKLYLFRIGLREDFIGLVNGVSTASLALFALSLRKSLQQCGAWWCLTFGTASSIVSSTLLALMTDPGAILVCALSQGLATTFLYRPAHAFRHRPCPSGTSVDRSRGCTLAGFHFVNDRKSLGRLVANVVRCGVGAFRSRSSVLRPRTLVEHPRLRSRSRAARTHASTSSTLILHEYSCCRTWSGGTFLPTSMRLPIRFCRRWRSLESRQWCGGTFLQRLFERARTFGRDHRYRFRRSEPNQRTLRIARSGYRTALGPLTTLTLLLLLPIFFYTALIVVESIPFAITAPIVRLTSTSMA